MNIKHYFVCANTAKGFKNYFSNSTQSLNKVFILKEGSSKGKSTIMKKIGKEFEKLQYDVEYIHCSFEPDIIEGVIIPKLDVGIVDSNISINTEFNVQENVNLLNSLDLSKLEVHKKDVLDSEKNIKQYCEKAYAEFSKGLKIHDEWEKIYIENMNFIKADKLTEEITTKLLGSTYLNKTSLVKERFFGGSTPYGTMDFVENITSDIVRRYFIKGRPGSGKSTMLKKILAEAKNRGIDAHVYHCGFDPDSLDMLLFPELNLCIFDSTAPHEYFPSRNGDSVIDMYEELINPGTDEAFEEQLKDIVNRYKLCTKKGIEYLSMAKYYRDQVEKLYIESTDFKVVDEIYIDIFEKIIK